MLTIRYFYIYRSSFSVILYLHGHLFLQCRSEVYHSNYQHIRISIMVLCVHCPYQPTIISISACHEAIWFITMISNTRIINYPLYFSVGYLSPLHTAVSVLCISYTLYNHIFTIRQMILRNTLMRQRHITNTALAYRKITGYRLKVT